MRCTMLSWYDEEPKYKNKVNITKKLLRHSFRFSSQLKRGYQPRKRINLLAINSWNNSNHWKKKEKLKLGGLFVKRRPKYYQGVVVNSRRQVNGNRPGWHTSLQISRTCGSRVYLLRLLKAKFMEVALEY